MALDCVLTPPSLDQGNKDTKLQTDGENDSDKHDDDEETDIDLEEGEILDSGEENEDQQEGGGFEKEQSPPVPPIPQIEAYHENENFNEECDDERWRKKKKRRNDDTEKKGDKRPNKKGRYIDHDQVEDENEVGWHLPNISPTKRKNRRDGSPHHNDSNMSGHSENEDGQNFRDFRGENRHRGNNTSTRNNRKGRGAIRRQRMAQERNKAKKRKGVEGKRNKSENRNRPKRETPRRAICKFYLDGKCHKKNDCQFSHDISPLKKKDLCKFFLNGFCAKGETCLFMHGDFPCKFFHLQGKCFFENGCRFSHEPLSNEMRMVLERHAENGTFDEEEPECNNMNAPSQMKRPSLLGSPPRHVKDAAEEWQQDLIQRLQLRDKKIDFGCHNAINLQQHNSPVKQQPFARPGNFYVETLPRTPTKNNEMGGMGMNRLNMDMPMMGGDMQCSMMGDMNVNIMDMNGPRMGEGNSMGMGNMGGPIMGDMNCQRMGDMGGVMMGDMNGPRMPDMNGPRMPDMNGPRMPDMNGPRMPDMNGPRMPDMGGPMMGMNFPMPFMNQDMMNQDRGDNTPPRNMRTPVPTDDEEYEALLEFDQFINQTRGTPKANVPPVNNFYEDDDEEDVVVAGGIDDQEDDQFSERILEVKKTAVLSSTKTEKTGEDGVDDSESQSTIISQGQSQSPTHDENSSDIGLPKPPMAIPVHLPKRTRELFLRIQQHQKKAGSNPNPDGEGTSDSQEKDGEEGSLSQDQTETKPATDSEVSNTTSLKPPEELPEVKEETSKAQVEEEYIDEEEEYDMDDAKANWLSSDEDDDVGDQPLTDVLKKLQQMPPPRSVPTPPKAINAGSIDITKMLNNIRQQATRATKTNLSGNQNFWQNILSAAMPFPAQNQQNCQPNMGPMPLISNPPPFLQNNIGDKGPFGLLKPGGLLPPPLLPQPPSLLGPVPHHLPLLQQSMLKPQLPNILDNISNSSRDPRDPRFRDTPSFTKIEKMVDLKKVPTARDPRLGGRDPRFSGTKEEPNSPSSTHSKIQINKVTNSIKSPSPPPPSAQLKPKEKRPSIEKQDTDKKSVVGSLNYRLFTVTVSPLNYSSYLFATQNDKKLLNDPRLKKLIENSPTNSLQKSISLSFPPDLSNINLQSEKNLGNSSSLTQIISPAEQPKFQGNVAKVLQEIRSAGTRNFLKKKDSGESKTELTSKAEVKSIIEATSSKTEATSNIDATSNKTEATLSKTEAASSKTEAASSKTEAASSKTEDTLNKTEHTIPSESPESNITDVVVEAPKPKTPPISHLPKSFTDPRLARLHQTTDPKRSRHVAIPKKKAKLQLPIPLDKDNLKNPDDKNEDQSKLEIKGGSLNRKKSLDYASPLNAYPDTESSSYSSYNRRPTPVNRTTTKINNTEMSAPEILPINIPKLPSLNEPITDMNNELESITNQSLKEVFKTIDPTASPFC